MVAHSGSIFNPGNNRIGLTIPDSKETKIVGRDCGRKGKSTPNRAMMVKQVGQVWRQTP